MTDRKTYIERTKRKLDELDNELSDMESRANETSADLKARYQDEISTLRDRKDKLEQQLDEVKRASEHAWVDLKAGLELAWDSVSEAVSSARKRFS